MYAGAGPTDPIYAVYGPTRGYEFPGGQQIILGPAGPPGSCCRCSASAWS